MTRSCKICHTIYDSGDKCPSCGASESSDSFKGRVRILNPEKSEIAQKLKTKKKGNFAIRVG